MQDQTRKGSGFDLALEVWSQRKWLAVLVFSGAFTVVVSIVTFLPNIYRSTATVLVEHQQIPEEFVRSTVTGALENRLQTITQEILSRSRLEDLINRFGLYTDLKEQVPLEEVVKRMRQDIELEFKGVQENRPDRTTIGFAISYKGSDPQTAVLVTNTLASFYIEENSKVRERQAAGTAQFLQVQLEEMKKRLDEQEHRVSEFKMRYMGELPQQQEANLATLERLNTQLRLNSDNQTRASKRQAALAEQLTEVDSSGPAGGPDATATRIAKLKQELTELRTRFSDKYPDIIQVKLEIAALEEQLTRTKSDRESGREEVPTSLYVLELKKALSEVDAEIKALKDEEKSLRQAIATYQRRVENTPKREQEFQELSRDYETTKELYRSLLKRYEDAQLAESMEQRQKGEQFRILDPAIPPKEPAAPKRLQLILMGFLLSFGLAAGAVVLAEQLDTSFHTVDELRAFTKVPVLVSIARIVTEADNDRKRWRFCLGVTTVMLGLALIVGASYYIAHGNKQLVWMLARGR